MKVAIGAVTSCSRQSQYVKSWIVIIE